MSGVPEARLARRDGGLVPETQGWFVVNAREAEWIHAERFGGCVAFEGEWGGDARFPEMGINISVLRPGQPLCMYHGEEGQEDFLVIHGECLAIVEGEERPMRAWDLLHCPPWTEHILVATGDGPCVLVAAGVRGKPGLLYPANEVAQRHGAAVETTTSSGDEAYAPFPPDERGPYRPGDLPDL